MMSSMTNQSSTVRDFGRKKAGFARFRAPKNAIGVALMTDRTKVPTEEFGFWKPEPRPPERLIEDCRQLAIGWHSGGLYVAYRVY